MSIFFDELDSLEAEVAEQDKDREPVVITAEGAD